MNRFQLEKLYEVNGLKDYRLKTTDDLLKTHGLDFKEVDGYRVSLTKTPKCQLEL